MGEETQNSQTAGIMSMPPMPDGQGWPWATWKALTTAARITRVTLSRTIHGPVGLFLSGFSLSRGWRTILSPAGMLSNERSDTLPRCHGSAVVSICFCLGTPEITPMCIGETATSWVIYQRCWHVFNCFHITNMVFLLSLTAWPSADPASRRYLVPLSLALWVWFQAFTANMANYWVRCRMPWHILTYLDFTKLFSVSCIQHTSL